MRVGELKIIPLSMRQLYDQMTARGCRISEERFFDFGMAVAITVPTSEGTEDKICGLIGMYTDGKECRLGHLWTDGTELVGSILYGAAWRAAKALGYKQITL